MSGACNGVKAKIMEQNPRAIYIHCHAHQLNLALVDSCKKLPSASDFFGLLEQLYVFMSSSVPHSLFLKKQKELHFASEIRLVKLSDTRWSCRHTSINAVKTTISAIVQTLEDIAEESGNRAVEARGLLFQTKSFHFFLSLMTFDRVFSITGNLSNLLQAKELNYAAAATCIEATKQTIIDLRNETVWKNIWQESVKLAEKHDVDISPLRPRRTRRLPSHLNDSSVEGPSGESTPVSEFRSQIFYATIDTLLQEMNQRFNELNLTLFKSMQALVPNSSSFLHLDTLHPFHMVAQRCNPSTGPMTKTVVGAEQKSYRARANSRRSQAES